MNFILHLGLIKIEDIVILVNWKNFLDINNIVVILAPFRIDTQFFFVCFGLISETILNIYQLFLFVSCIMLFNIFYNFAKIFKRKGKKGESNS